VRKLVLAPLVVAALASISVSSIADAAGPALDVTPNPVPVNTQFAASNAPGAENTCVGGEVNIRIYSVTEGEYIFVNVPPLAVPDDEGNWTISGIGPLAPATYRLEASCDAVVGTEVGARADAPFDYDPLQFEVAEPAPVVTPPTNTQPATPIGAAPAFTG
jgi:hypothetical protein